MNFKVVDLHSRQIAGVAKALVELAIDQAAGKRWAELWLKREWPDRFAYDRDRKEREKLETKLVTDLVDRLRKGTLVAAGIWPGGRCREPVPAEWWGGDGGVPFEMVNSIAQLRLRIRGDRAQGHGSVIASLMIHRDGGLVRRTGLSGRPSSKSLYLKEMESRATRGELSEKVSQEAAYLCGWLQTEYPEAAQAKPKAVEEGIREAFRALRNTRKPSA